MNNLNSKLNKNFVFEVIDCILTGIVIAFLITRIFVPTVVLGNSMHPTLLNNERLFVNKLAYVFEGKTPKRNDIIVFTPGNNENILYIKRVIAVEGDTIAIKDNKVYVNSVEIKEPYLKEKMNTPDIEEQKINKGYVFVMGDNRNNSADSRIIGPIHIDSILGKLITFKKQY